MIRHWNGSTPNFHGTSIHRWAYHSIRHYEMTKHLRCASVERCRLLRGRPVGYALQVVLPALLLVPKAGPLEQKPEPLLAAQADAAKA